MQFFEVRHLQSRTQGWTPRPPLNPPPTNKTKEHALEDLATLASPKVAWPDFYLRNRQGSLCFAFKHHPSKAELTENHHPRTLKTETGGRPDWPVLLAQQLGNGSVSRLGWRNKMQALLRAIK